MLWLVLWNIERAMEVPAAGAPERAALWGDVPCGGLCPVDLLLRAASLGDTECGLSVWVTQGFHRENGVIFIMGKRIKTKAQRLNIAFHPASQIPVPRHAHALLSVALGTWRPARRRQPLPAAGYGRGAPPLPGAWEGVPRCPVPWRTLGSRSPSQHRAHVQGLDQFTSTGFFL